MRRDERGVVVVMYAVAMTGLVTMAALALDLSQLRSDRRVNKTVADSAVRAGLVEAGQERLRDFSTERVREIWIDGIKSLTG